VPVLKLNAVQVLALSCFGVLLGTWIKKKIPIFDWLNIPASIVGGLVYAILTLILRDRYLNFEMDLVLRDILMVGFFTTIGMSASLQIIRRGGPQVLLFFGVATVGAVLQNIAGIGIARIFSLNPLLGIVSGSVALTGGPATALAFGQTFEGMGVSGAMTLGVASAMFGITAGGLLGGYIGGWLIHHNNLKPPFQRRDGLSLVYMHKETTEVMVMEPDEDHGEPLALEADSSPLLGTVIAVAIAMGLGTVISSVIQGGGLTLPAYVGAMLAAAVIRNLDDRFHWIGISQKVVDDVGGVSLYVFIVMALLTLRLWELLHLALPMLVMLLAQIVLIWIMCVTIAFRAMGRDYEAAVMSGGFCGFMLGTTANAMACMDVLTRKYGPAPRAFIVVPLVGAFLIDFTNALVITNMTDLVRAILLK
jgi:glutamate:Na+ symporter, ESS family